MHDFFPFLGHCANVLFIYILGKLLVQMFTFCGVQSLCSSTVFRIVVDEHVVGNSQKISLHTWGEWYDHLEKCNDCLNNNKQIIII